MKLVYVKGSLEISVKNGWGTSMAMWNLFDTPCPELHPNGSTITLGTVREMGGR